MRMEESMSGGTDAMSTWPAVRNASHRIAGLVRARPCVWQAPLLAANALFRMSSSRPVTPPLARLLAGEADRGNSRLLPGSVVLPVNLSCGANAVGSQTTFTGGALTLRAGSEVCSVSELELAAPCMKTEPNSPMALPVKACAVVP